MGHMVRTRPGFWPTCADTSVSSLQTAVSSVATSATWVAQLSLLCGLETNKVHSFGLSSTDFSFERRGLCPVCLLSFHFSPIPSAGAEWWTRQRSCPQGLRRSWRSCVGSFKQWLLLTTFGGYFLSGRDSSPYVLAISRSFCSRNMPQGLCTGLLALLSFNWWTPQPYHLSLSGSLPWLPPGPLPRLGEVSWPTIQYIWSFSLLILFYLWDFCGVFVSNVSLPPLDHRCTAGQGLGYLPVSIAVPGP